MNEMKTMEGWQEHAIATGNDRMDSYLKAGDLVAQDVVDYFAEVVPPRAMSEHMLQVGAPHDMRLGEDGEKHPTYATFAKGEDGWKYCGPCFAGETVEPDPAGRENSFDSPEYEYDTGDGIERVQLTVGTYDYGDNLYVGLEYFDQELGSFDHYGDVTVNIETLPPLFAAIDTNNNNADKIVDFLEKNDIAINTGLTKESGWCSYPVFVFNPAPLLKADPDRLVEHLVNRGIDSQTILEMKQQALGDAGKYVGNIGEMAEQLPPQRDADIATNVDAKDEQSLEHPLDDLIKEAKDRLENRETPNENKDKKPPEPER